jgi:hypothetical protein
MGERHRMMRQLSDLDRVLDFLERMNLRDMTDVPTKVTDLLNESGVVDTMGERPMTLIPRVLNRQQHLRRQLASAQRASSR